MKLSNRLQRIHDQIPEGSRMADIGSDHALLPVAAIRSGKASTAVAGEVNPGPYDAACKQVSDAGLQEKITVRRGDGLDVISAREVDVITIAGMGGALIASILDRGLSKLEGVQLLILQPNVGEDILRRWLLEHHWVVVAEQLLEEDGKIYEIITAMPKESSPITNEEVYRARPLKDGVQLTEDLLLRMGPYLTDRVSEVFFAKWESEINKLQGVLQSISKSDQESSRDKAAEVQELITSLQEVLACLPKVKP
ncbi:tRNA (adenine-N(1))-methyltransferase [Paenibacillus barcinonensis]|uniref:tRNA (Adenine-N(1))-methyltransferase n=1 Tax=Paenibacillus barcinonensis TaxID=198119 RepID=A0A2V4V566_PAEBA|nr:tRNA (adenine(22)-N(1))-methyltransferase TrmK [Paenibacillus barcinonensis]PYE47433.1 tRNA (adenine22-N1)-methyltransferase [Paenibacillus barcinonensis]QKS56351.1 tRNA (adenine-N(1))-methyltransferase [Paenibacillus barcinonensis]